MVEAVIYHPPSTTYHLLLMAPMVPERHLRDRRGHLLAALVDLDVVPHHRVRGGHVARANGETARWAHRAAAHGATRRAIHEDRIAVPRERLVGDGEADELLRHAGRLLLLERRLAHEVALQVAAMKPRYVNRAAVPADVVVREKDVVLGQIKNDPKNASKPENVMQKIVEGRIDKFYKESCLTEQLYVKDDSKTILVLAEEVGKKIGTKVSIVAFRRWMIGEKAAAPVAPEADAACACACAG